MKKQIIILLLLFLIIGWAISGCIDNKPKQIIPEKQRTMELTASKYILDQSPDRLNLDTTTLTATILDENGVPMSDYEVSFKNLPADAYFIGDNPTHTDSRGQAQITVQIDKYNSIQNPTSMKMKSTTRVIAECEDLDLDANVSIDVDVQDWVTMYYSGTSDITFEDEITAFYANGIEIKLAVNDPADWHNIFDSSRAVTVSLHQYRAFEMGQVKRGSMVYLFYEYKIAASQEPLDHGEIGQTYLHTYNGWVHNVAIVPPSSGIPSDEWGEFSYKIP